MIKQNKHIEIVSSSIIEFSSMGKISRDAIHKVLSRHYSSVGITLVDDLDGLEALVASRPDLVVLGMNFITLDGERQSHDKIWLSDYLEAHGIAHTGSTSQAHIVELNKHLSKQRMSDRGIMTAPFFVSKQNQPVRHTTNLSFPLFVKPSDRGGGLGIDNDSIVHNLQAMNSKIQSIRTTLSSDSLVEEYLPGREFSVAILKNEFSGKYSVMPIEIVAPSDRAGFSMLSGAVKRSNNEQVLEVIDQIIRDKVCSLGLAAFLALGARDYGRIDIRLDGLGTANFLEANLIPSLINGYGSFPKACELNIGLNHERMLIRIVKLGLARQVKNFVELVEPVTLSRSVSPAAEVAFEPA